MYNHDQKKNLFKQADDIISRKRQFTIEEIVTILEELSLIKASKWLQEQIIEVTYEEILNTLLAPVNSLFEEEYG